MNTKEPYIVNIEKLAAENVDFRRVLYTGPHSQLVLMSLLPGEEIGAETHTVDQFFRFEKGSGSAIVDGTEYPVTDGTALLVPAGLEHNIRNTGPDALKLYTVYAPANHIHGRVHPTKADAERDVVDEEYGHHAGISV